MTNLIIIFLQNSSTLNKEALKNIFFKKRSVWREKTEMRGRKDKLGKLGENKIIPPSLCTVHLATMVTKQCYLLYFFTTQVAEVFIF